MNHCLVKRIVVLLALLLIISSCAKSNEQMINEAINEIKPDLPWRVNERMALVDLKAGKDEVIFLCEVRGVDESKIDKETLIPRIKTAFIPVMKKQKDTERIFKRNIRTTFIFNNVAGDELFSVGISREDLGY